MVGVGVDGVVAAAAWLALGLLADRVDDVLCGGCRLLRGEFDVSLAGGS